MNNKKDLYIDNSLIGSFSGNSLFEDIYIEHNSLPEMKFDDIDTKVEFMDQEIGFPLIISAMIGGTERGLELNELLVSLANEFNLPISVGSQEEFLHDNEASSMFITSMEDDQARDLFVLSNLSARTDLDQVDLAMKNIKAKGLSLYLNAAQEIASFDGDTDFSGIIDNIEEIAKVHSDHLIVKEKSMGMSKETVARLAKAGVKYIDISGHGGTNFLEMENLRNYKSDYSDLYIWGIPTAKSIINARAASSEVKIIASGGIKTGLDIAKALIIGADYTAIAGELLKYLLHGGYDQARAYLEDLIYKTKMVMFLLGAKNIEELKKVDYRITGKLKEII